MSTPSPRPDTTPRHSPAPEPAPGERAKIKQARWAAASGFFGAIAEYYDFALYAPAAALFFGPLFFAPLGASGATLASLATFAVAYIARPVGALFFGHLGDRWGRQKVLFLTLSLMGASTVAIGLLPTYEQAGMLGAVLLVALRILQGLSAGVEQSGSGTLSAETAPKNKRALYTSWTMMGVSLGWFLGPAVLSSLSVDNEWLLGGGWRVAFLVSAPLVIGALWVRAQVREPEQAVRARAAAPASVPLFTLVRRYPLNLLRVIGCSLHMLVGVTFNVFVVSWAVERAGMSKAAVLGALSFAGLSTTFLQPVWAWLSDILGRRVLFIGSCLSLIALLPVVFWSLYSGSAVLVTVAMTGFYVCVMAGNVVQASFYPEMFPAEVRFTGVAVGTQIGLVIVGFSPLIYSLLTAGEDSTFWPGWGFAAACWALAALCALSAPETAPRKLKGREDLIAE